MKVIICENYNEMSEKAALLVKEQIIGKADTILGLATGSTPVGMYTRLAEMCDKGELDFSKVRSFNLDEYYPISPENDQSYRYFMNKNLFTKINIPMENTRVPRGDAEDAAAECADYDKSIEAAGGIDLQILGIGRNGHIGFNEPDTFLYADTHVTGLTANTIEANSRFFESEDLVPKKAITMGMRAIMQAKKIVMLISGKEKHEVLMEMLSGKVKTENPATIASLHADITVVCDKEAYNG